MRHQHDALRGVGHGVQRVCKVVDRRLVQTRHGFVDQRQRRATGQGGGHEQLALRAGGQGQQRFAQQIKTDDLRIAKLVKDIGLTVE